ncbi:MAG: hypothetical protein IT529_00970 [Burkholderiales bacterium]|nr:hypothetical protein [Burkholderiales bacterium]
MAGVFITRGMTIAIPPGGFSIGIGEDGGMISNLTIHVRFDVCPTWCELALKHLADARTRRAAREAAWGGTDEAQKAAALEREFEASMQAMMAAAIAIDAFYAVLQTCVQIPQTLKDQWRKTRTARYSQVTEVIRRAFQLKPKATQSLRKTLQEIYRLRDIAVHPVGKIEAPLLHPELNVGMEWRFVWFRASNAEAIVKNATWILWTLSHDSKPKDGKVGEYVGALRDRLALLFPDGHPVATARQGSKSPPAGDNS